VDLRHGAFGHRFARFLLGSSHSNKLIKNEVDFETVFVSIRHKNSVTTIDH
jgi:hypothetical protein